MADQPTIFSNQEVKQETPAQEATETQNQSNPLEDLLKEIKREDGTQKYSTVEDALKGQVHAQKTIFDLKNETKEKDSKLTELEQKVAEIDALKAAVEALTQKKDEQTSVKPFSEEDIQKQVFKAMNEARSKEVSEQNIKTVLGTLNEKFGSEAEKKFYSTGQELGFSAEEMNALAASKPKAVFTMLGLNESGGKQAPVFNPSTGSLNTAGLKPKTETAIRRNDKRLPVAATNAELMEQASLAHDMVLELQERGLSVRDLAKPEVFKKIFK